MSNPLLDKDFLLKLDQQKIKEKFIRIISLDFNENPLEQIEGRATGGSVNIDGTSAVRRSCSLTMVAENLDINNFYWGIKNKFKLEVGLTNNINPNYPNIIWFPLGIYIITSFSTSYSTNNYTISISGKDKMCLLNGEMGGSLPAQIDFGTEEYWDKETNIVTKTSVPIKTIIQEAIHTYGNELFSNIIINDLEDSGLELMEYRGDTPMYMFYNVEQQQYNNFTLNGNGECRIKDSGKICLISELEENGGHYDKRIEVSQDLSEVINEPSIVNFKLSNSQEYSEDYTISKIEYGDTPGYKITDLTYTGDLIANVGESIASVLDKIKNMLGEFEYFYDLDGRFIFQKKKTYINTLWNNIINNQDEEYVNSASQSSSVIYSFEDNNLITAFQNNPTLNNLKNDYTIWGKRKTVSGTEIPVHYRCAIDQKPLYYKAYDGKIYISDENLFNSLIAKMREDLKNDLIGKAKNFKLSYDKLNKWTNKFPLPKKLEDGSWTAGWWDIRDWYEYYQLLTGEIPNATMKWYSSNTRDGCTWVDNRYAWLVIMEQWNNSWNADYTHGSSTSYGNRSYICTKYISYLDENGKIITEKTDEQKEFWMPYAGCSDTHTYLSFLKNDIEAEGSLVYFYNPQFPQANNYEDLINGIINEKLKNSLFLVDWREVIYQMALDFYQYAHDDNYSINIINNNMKPLEEGCYYPTGRTGYEQYYVDLQGFWRQLYNPNPVEEEADNYFTTGNNKCWNKSVQESPELLNFWFDFLDENESELGQYSVQLIGDRTKSVNDSNVSAIYFREIPNIIFTTAEEYSENDEVKDKTGYVPVLITDSMESLFSISAKGKSAKDAFDELLYNYSYCIENITLTSLPIYYLSPNARIKVVDTNTNINGEYLVSRITLPLTYNGTMSITASKAPERLN